MVATQFGHTDICDLLLAHGSSVNDIEPKTMYTALHIAAQQGHQALAKTFLSRGAEVDPQDHAGERPLHHASIGGHLECVLALLKAGASVTLPTIDGVMPIHSAAEFNWPEIVAALLEYGCSPNMVSFNYKRSFGIWNLIKIMKVGLKVKPIL